ncbi:hypothetical protein HCN44_009589 [Aphidius gifuensis]|uniref:Odorant-binding protein n=1 Tax=Aphidius gifuensis TaxID=684658 RepID=A0A834Y7Z9_APHGI|nr:hypothetical protein HCN44_009589 [Aphidius gifuensis]
MEYFLLKLLLLLSISFVTGENNSLSNDYDTDEESITVHLKSYKEEVLQCTIQIETDETGFYDFHQLYDKNMPNLSSNAFKYIGKWTIIEKYSCDKSFWNIATFVYDLTRKGCYREYNIFFNPRTDVEVMSMTWTATKITRKALYDNKTLTVFVQSEVQPITMCENNSLSNDYDTDEETITVQLKSYEDEVLQCTIQIKTDETGFSDYHQLYDKNKANLSSTAFEYIGTNDNSCSFIIYHKRSIVKKYFDEINAFNRKWTIIEKYSCDKSIWNILTFVYDLKRQGCYREYNIFFNPTKDVEILAMTLSATKIIRKAPYDNETLTVFVQSEKQPISMCKLYIGFNYSPDSRSNDIIIYDKYKPFLPPAESGIEYIGLNDNSCSVRIHLAALNTTYKENNILNRKWAFVVMHDNNDDYQNKNSGYSFYMNSKKWWIDHHYSKVFLRNKLFMSTDVQHY